MGFRVKCFYRACRFSGFLFGVFGVAGSGNLIFHALLPEHLFFHCVGCCNGMGILRGPTRQLMFSRRAAYARSMLLTCAYADLRGKHRQPTRTYAPILHRLAYADPTQTYALQAKCYAADFQ